jgi:signal peptidase I
MSHDQSLAEIPNDLLNTESDSVKDASSDKPVNFARTIREWMIVVFIAVSAAVLMKMFVVQQFYVKGQSMDHTLAEQDRVLVNKLSYRLHDPRRGDVVVLERQLEGSAHDDLIKRVIALPGETIEIKNCDVYIDGRLLNEPYLNQDDVGLADLSARCNLVNVPAIQMPANSVYVMGDNRAHSGDSRGFGPVTYDQIIGRAFVVIWPRADWQWL